jgi:hypothetical protein
MAEEKRRIPLCMTPEVEKKEQVKATRSKKEVAERVSNDADGRCAICVESLSADALHEHLLSAEQDDSSEEEYGHGLQEATANGIPVRVCLQHLVVMPLRDKDQNQGY